MLDRLAKALLALGTILYFLWGLNREGRLLNFLVQKGGLIGEGSLIERGRLKAECTVSLDVWKKL